MTKARERRNRSPSTGRYPPLRGNRCQENLLLLVAVALPVIFNPLGFDVFEVPKFTSLVLVCLLLVSCKLYAVVGDGAVSWYPSPLDLPWLAWLALAALAALFSLAPAQSLIGREPRFDGWLSLLCYALVCWFTYQVVRGNPIFADRLVPTIVITGAVVSSYAVLQYVGLDPVPWKLYGVDPGRAFSTAGSPMHLGAYLSLVAPLSLGVLLRQRNTARRALFAAASVAVFAAVLLSYSRAAWLALALVAILALMLLGRKRRWVAVTVVAALVVGIGTFSLVQPADKSSGGYSVVRRIASIVDPATSSRTERLIAWDVALRASVDRPLVGWGQDTFGLVFPEYQPARWETQGNKRPMDKVHNLYLELLFATGILGLGAFLWLMLVSCREMLAGLRKTETRHPEDRIMLSAISAALLAYLVQAFFGFNMIGVTPIFFSLLGICVALAEQVTHDRPLVSLRMPRLGRAAYVPLALLVVALALFSVRPLVADLRMRRGVDALNSNQFSLGQEELQRAALAMPHSDAYRRAWARSYLMYAQKTGTANAFDRAIELFEEARRISPQATETYRNLGDAYLWAYEALNKPLLQSARRSFAEFARLSPNSTEARFKLGYVLALENRTTDALREWRRAARLDPAYPSLSTNMAIAYLKTGDRAAARAAALSALQADADDAKAQALLEETSASR